MKKSTLGLARWENIASLWSTAAEALQWGPGPWASKNVTSLGLLDVSISENVGHAGATADLLFKKQISFMDLVEV